MTISGNDQTDIFTPMPPASMGQEGSITTFNATSSEGKSITGNAVFTDTVADASNPSETTTTITVYQISGGTSADAMLAVTQPDDPQIFPDPDMDTTSTTTFTFTSEEVNEKASDMNIDPNQLAADRALYGPALTDFAISQGVNPSVLASDVNSASTSLGLTPPFSSLPQDTQNAVMLEVLISESNENLPAGTAGVTPAKTANTDLVNQIRAEMDLQESLANPGMQPPVLTKQDVTILYGQNFTNQAQESGQDPVQFALKANTAIANLAPPVEGLTQEQQSQMIFEMLLENSGESPPPGGILMTKLTPSQRTQLSSSMSNSSTTSTTTTTSSGSVKKYSSLQSIKGPNPWLSGNALTAFVVAFLGVIQTVMRNKIEQGKLIVQALQNTISMAKMAASYDKQEAEINFKNALAGALSSALAIGVACGAAAYSHGNYHKEEEPQHAEFVADDPKDANLAAARNKDLNEQDNKVTQAKNKADEKTATRKQAEADHKKVVEQETAAVSKKKQLEKRISDRATANPDRSTWSQKMQDDETSDQNALTQAEQDRVDANTKRPRLKTVLDNAKADEKTHTDAHAAEVRKRNQMAANTLGGKVHMESPAEFTARKQAISDRNATKAQKVATGQAIGQTSSQIGQFGSSAMQAYTAIQLGQVKGMQALIQGWQQIIQNSLSQATQAFSANSDSISAFISALQQLAQAVAQAMAAMLKQ